MPLKVEASPASVSVTPPRERDGAASPILIGLINNMPDSALEGTEAQFRELLAAAAGRQPVRLRLSYFPEVQRGTAAAETLKERYWPIERLLAEPLDALIVTGAEPRTSSLTEESYWDRLVDVLQWAGKHTVSSIWSCLAAHAAVLHLDGVERRPLPEKCCGVFEHGLSEHPLTTGVLAPLPIPHSRWNDLALGELTGVGYTILAQSPESGAGIFVKHHGRSLLVFVHGHPEYDERALLKEYQRDVGRFLSGKQARYPTLPSHYFSERTLSALRAFEETAMADPTPGRLADFPFSTAAASLAPTWRQPGVRLYRNWLSYVVAGRLGARFHEDVSFVRST